MSWIQTAALMKLGGLDRYKTAPNIPLYLYTVYTIADFIG